MNKQMQRPLAVDSFYIPCFVLRKSQLRPARSHTSNRRAALAWR